MPPISASTDLRCQPSGAHWAGCRGNANLLFRAFLVWLRRNGPRLDPHAVGRLGFRVLPTDLDVLGPMNNGVYLSIMDVSHIDLSRMDLGQMDLLQPSGVLARLSAAGFVPVMADETIGLRRSLRLWQRFAIETRIVGYDEKAVHIEQRAVVVGEIFARATMRARFVRKLGGTVTTAELAAVAGIDTTGPSATGMGAPLGRGGRASPRTRIRAERVGVRIR